MKKAQKELLNIMKIDPLHVAEQLSGKSYKEDESTTLLGFAIQMDKSNELQRRLSELGDTQFSNQLDDYLKIVQSFGFEIIYQAPFISDNKTEQHFILWHNDLSILLNFDTFTWEGHAPGVNGGHFYYNWSPHCGNWSSGVTSSGGFVSEKDMPHLTMWEKDFSSPYYIPNFPDTIKWEDNITYEEWKLQNKPIELKHAELWEQAIKEGKRVVWSGDHDCREALITKIKALFENGIFLKDWKECAFPWLTNYSDHKGSNRQFPFTDLYEKTTQIINTFPDHIKKSIGEYKQ